MAFLPYDQRIIDKIQSSKVWRLKEKILCEKGFYEAGSRLFSDEIVLLHYDNDTKECVFEETTATDGMEIKINANDFEKYFEADEKMNDIINEKIKTKEESEKQYAYQVGQLISGTSLFASIMLGIAAQDLRFLIPICIFGLGFSICSVILFKLNKHYKKIIENLEAKENAYLLDDYDFFTDERKE